MSDKPPNACACCTRRLPEEGGVKINGKDYCDQEHGDIHAEYHRLCREAIEIAREHDKPGKKGEADFGLADAFLQKALGLPIRSSEPLKAPVPALTE